MEHITYLLGAGASQKCLPIVSEMSKKIDEVIKEFDVTTHYLSAAKKNELNVSTISSLKADLEWLKDICDIEKNFSVDTYAKKLKLSGKIDEYNRLRNILTLYFTLQQKFKTPDVRYDNFWASLLDKSNQFPDNIKILSWNYDFQLEVTYQDFFNLSSLNDSARVLNVITNKTNSIDYLPPEKFTIFKLNGSATYNSDVIKDGSQYIVDNLKHCSNDTAVEEIIKYYSLSTDNPFAEVSNHLSFAWEHNHDSNFYKHLKSALEKTTILVVIGYSFPYFNRTSDKLILNAFMPNLSRAYFQDTKPDNIKERFRAIRNNLFHTDYIPVHDTYQFYFPNEL